MRYRAGDAISIIVDREGLGMDEGIAHLPDETMVVVVGAGSSVGKTVDAVVTSVIQTSLGDCLLASAKL
ncbi:MAG: hypothetical protein Q7T82_06410 [Armatimonadota bacterium]|nr:hypothetical protein [Armatimonadota bacterium]